MADLSQRQLIASMKQAPLFSALKDSALADLLSRCIARKYAAAQIIFSPSQKADKFFVVLAGQVKVFKLSPRGDEQILHLCGPGDTFGEAAMWAGIHFPAHAQAVCDSVLLHIPHKALADAIQHNAELAVGMLVGLSAKLREFNVIIERLSLKEVPSRIAAAILAEAHPQGARTFRLRQTKRQLAAQIGTVAETLSRGLGKLKELGLIEVDGSQITILDEAGLRDVEEGNGQ